MKGSIRMSFVPQVQACLDELVWSKDNDDSFYRVWGNSSPACSWSSQANNDKNVEINQAIVFAVLVNSIPSSETNQLQTSETCCAECEYIIESLLGISRMCRSLKQAQWEAREEKFYVLLTRDIETWVSSYLTLHLHRKICRCIHKTIAPGAAKRCRYEVFEITVNERNKQWPWQEKSTNRRHEWELPWPWSPLKCCCIVCTRGIQSVNPGSPTACMLNSKWCAWHFQKKIICPLLGNLQQPTDQ